jgi:hypothetical protein
MNKTTKMENGVKSKPFYRYKDVQHMLIDACKKLVEYCKRKNLQSQLSKMLKQECRNPTLAKCGGEAQHFQN